MIEIRELIIKAEVKSSSKANSEASRKKAPTSSNSTLCVASLRKQLEQLQER